MEAGFEGTADIRFHGVTDHDDVIEWVHAGLGEFATSPMEHVAVGFAEVIGAAT